MQETYSNLNHEELNKKEKRLGEEAQPHLYAVMNDLMLDSVPWAAVYLWTLNLTSEQQPERRQNVEQRHVVSFKPTCRYSLTLFLEGSNLFTSLEADNRKGVEVGNL